MRRTTPIPLQEPCPSCQAGLAVPAPVLCWHAPAPNPTQPPPPSGVSHVGMPLPQPCSLGLLPSTDTPCAGPPAPRDLGPVVSTPGARRVRPLLCPAGLWADGRPAGPWPAPASSEGPASPQMPPPAFAFLAGLPGIRCPALHTPGGSGWVGTRPATPGTSGFHFLVSTLLLSGAVVGVELVYVHPHPGDSVAGHT